MVIGKEPTDIGNRYIELREQGHTGKQACSMIREEFKKFGLDDSTIRGYGAKVRRPTFFPRPPKEPLGTTRKVFTLINELASQFEAEAKKKSLNGSELLSLILSRRYTKKKR